jgi:putative transposase
MPYNIPMERKLDFSTDEYYHVYNRGVEKREIFLNDGDEERFIRLLYLANSTKPFVFRDVQNLPLSQIRRGDLRTSIGAYCLMPNHFHLLVRETQEGGISTFMEKLTTGYSMYFNKKYKRVGPLFQGRFKARHVNNDNYLKYLFAYIHLNPLKIIDADWKEKGITDPRKAKEYLNKYPYSSYDDFLGNRRPERVILNKVTFPEYFETVHDFEEYLEDWLTYNEEFSPELTEKTPAPTLAT